MKKLIALALVAMILGTSAIGCGSSTTKAPTPAEKDKDTKKP